MKVRKRIAPSILNGCVVEVDMKHVDLILLNIYLTFLFNGCSTIDPHANFKQVLNTAVGTSLDEAARPGKVIGGRTPLAETKLANGNIEYEYLYMKRFKCVFALEVDPATKKIVNTRIVKGERDCIIIP